jgi:hemolysin activation/secretion protein
LGGPYGVRAYPVSQGGGDQGFIVSTELQHRLSDNWSAGVFADAGMVQQHKNLYTNWQGQTRASNEYGLAATGVTVKYSYKNFSVASMAGYRIGDNPLYSFSGKQLNSDNEYKSLQLWVRASLDF